MERICNDIICIVTIINPGGYSAGTFVGYVIEIPDSCDLFFVFIRHDEKRFQIK